MQNSDLKPIPYIKSAWQIDMQIKSRKSIILKKMMNKNKNNKMRKKNQMILKNIKNLR